MLTPSRTDTGFLRPHWWGRRGADVRSVARDERTFCPACFRSLWQGGRCKRRDCPGYAPIYLRDQAERLKANLAAWEGRTCLVTLTAPGREVLPWDQSKCRSGAHRCSGKRGCRVHWLEAAVWNADLTVRLGRLLKLARERVRHKHGQHAKVVVLGYVCESQQRGVFHPHIVLGYTTAADRAALDTFRGALAQRRGEYGRYRTQVVRRRNPGSFLAADAARYISKYLRPDGAKTSFVPLLEAVNRITPRGPETGRLRYLLRPVYISPKLTKITGVTMGFLRFKRWVWYASGPGSATPISSSLIRHRLLARSLCEIDEGFAARHPGPHRTPGSPADGRTGGRTRGGARDRPHGRPPGSNRVPAALSAGHGVRGIAERSYPHLDSQETQARMGRRTLTRPSEAATGSCPRPPQAALGLCR